MLQEELPSIPTGHVAHKQRRGRKNQGGEGGQTGRNGGAQGMWRLMESPVSVTCTEDVLVQESMWNHQPLHPNHQAHSLSDLPVVNNINNSKVKEISLTKKTRLNYPSNPQSIGSCTVQPPKAPVFDQSMVCTANPFEDSRNLAWSGEQQWHHLMQTNMDSSVFQHHLEGKPLSLNTNGGFSGINDMGLFERPLIDAWSMGVTETEDNGGNIHDKSPLSSPNCGHGNAVAEEMCHIHMGLGLIDS